MAKREGLLLIFNDVVTHVSTKGVYFNMKLLVQSFVGALSHSVTQIVARLQALLERERQFITYASHEFRIPIAAAKCTSIFYSK